MPHEQKSLLPFLHRMHLCGRGSTFPHRVDSQSRHGNEEKPFPHIGVDSAAQILRQRGAQDHAEMCNCPDEGSIPQTHGALAGQDLTGSPGDTPNTTQDARKQEKRETQLLCVSHK